MLLTEALAQAVIAAAERGAATVEISPDLGRTQIAVQPRSDGFVHEGEPYVFPDRIKPRTIYQHVDGEWQVLARFGSALYKLVPTEWGPPVFEIDGIKMLVSQKVSPLEDARAKVQLAKVHDRAVLDCCGGLGYFAVAALEQGALRIVSFEKSPEVRWLRSVNPWSPRENERLHLTAGSVLDHLPALASHSFGAILHDPPRFGIAGELYSQDLYEQFARLLAPRGRLFHYVGSPNQLSSGRNVQQEVAKRLRAAGFTAVRSHGDGLLAERR